MPAGPWFDAKTFRFLQELTLNNEREWFQENKGRYEEHLKEPALHFIEAFAPRLAKLSKHFRADARPVGGSLFRIYKDTRFSKDKAPYKTHLGIHFRHENAKDAHAPGFYLHVEPGGSFAAAGIWHPPGDALAAIRQRIQDEPAGWKKAANGKAFRDRFALEGDSLKRAPKGVDPEHPLIDDLRRKDFIAVTGLSEADVKAKDLDRRLHEAWKASLPFVRFLCGALDQPA